MARDPNGDPHRVVIVGGGFAGLAAAKGLADAPCSITLIDRRNYHLFQPLLYQVATAALSPADIAAPLRRILSRQRNCEVILGAVESVDVAARTLTLRGPGGALDTLAFDTLIIATGATHSYFGRDDWAPLAPGLKDVEDALELRRRFLLAFERAEREADLDRRRASLTFIIVGGGPTGVELAGAMAEIAHNAIPKDFRRIDTASARVILVEAGDRVLGAMHPDLGDRARRDLESLGVTVRTGARVTEIDRAGVTIGEGGSAERVEAATVFWAAGVRASSLARALGAPLDRSGRVHVEPDLSLPGAPHVFVAGDLASVQDPGSDAEVPGVAPAAMQMGRYIARTIRRELASASPPAREPFRYRDKGILATIGRGRAVAEIGRRRFAGAFAWLLWLGVHIAFLIGFRNRLIVLINWAWSYITFQRGARLITGGRAGDA